RMRDTTAFTVDPLTLIHTQDAARGNYNLGFDQIDISFHMSSTETQRSYDHEMIHVCGGRTIEKTDDVDGKYKILKSGLGLLADYSKVAHRWINEAVTQKLTFDLEPIDEGENRSSHTYDKYVVLYKKILEKIDEKLFLRAYFENTSDSDSPHPHLDALNEEILRIYGTDLLSEIDVLIEENGLENVEGMLKERL
ncbi:MAG: hypothetical protein WC761_03450, partial [Candidatus Paceibacterota bacterium]